MTVSDVELIIPNESGIITILLDGKERRYMKEKFIEFLIKNKGNKMDLSECGSVGTLIYSRVAWLKHIVSVLKPRRLCVVAQRRKNYSGVPES